MLITRQVSGQELAKFDWVKETILLGTLAVNFLSGSFGCKAELVAGGS